MAGPSDHFRQTITYAPLLGRDAYGKPTFGSSATAPARVQPQRKMIRTADGSEFLASFVVYTAAPIALTDRVWFPGELSTDSNKARRPAAIDDYVDGAGVTRYRQVWF
jgi:hypothetical protein